MKDVPKAIESTRLIAAIARVRHDIGIAEELAQDALVTALELWPEEGIPEDPGAWLMTGTKRRAIDSPKASSTTSTLAHRLSVISAP
jgi:predicted RNA polymerase sigma factor